MKTLAIRLEDEQHARLSILARLSGDTVTEVIRAAIERQLDTMAASPELSAKANQLTAAIEREAAEQRDAIAALFGPTPSASSRGRAKKTSA